MAANHFSAHYDHLSMVAEEGFPLIDRFIKSQRQGSSLQGHLQDQYHHQYGQNQHQYIYRGPQVCTVMIKEPAVGRDNNLQATKRYNEGKYVYQAPEVPTKEKAVICSNEVAQHFEGMRHAYQVPQAPSPPAKEPVIGSKQAAALKHHDTWFLYKVPQVPTTKDQPVIDCDKAAQKHGGFVIKEFGKSKSNPWAYYN